MRAAVAQRQRFDVRTALAFCDSTLARPPKRSTIVRVAGVGRCVVRFVLPLELCLPTNRVARAGFASSKWKLAKLKQDCFLAMLLQAGRADYPLRGRPMVRCVRFSSVEPDRYNDGFKVAIDRLRAKPGGLGYIVDDSPKHAQVEQWWEYAPPGSGCGLVEVWTGAPIDLQPRRASA
ncbi:MAG TPA: hypothetical protein VFT98_04505 [Myxococcota bacterium]|nr:hypothetical protein [Myxococcota bacterium]